MKTSPSEIIYWQVLPAIRREIVFQMKGEGLKQKEIADILELTPSAISQYLKSKRGEHDFREEFKKEILNSTKNIISKKSTPFEETNLLIKKFQKSKEICGICHTKNNTKKSCEVCFD